MWHFMVWRQWKWRNVESFAASMAAAVQIGQNRGSGDALGGMHIDGGGLKTSFVQREERNYNGC